jgi:hypothetical protein
MQDSELKSLLLETCPVRPGQESRAWSALRGHLYQNGQPHEGWRRFYPIWRGPAAVAAGLGLIFVVGIFAFSRVAPISVATADSQSPGIYATSFYSNSAQAQVVWLNGMEPATDKLTYLDPTTVIAGTDAASPTRDPNSL